ncbi:MAG: hypothetical protein ABEH78_03845 [Haloferacaceae archaeon]
MTPGDARTVDRRTVLAAAGAGAAALAGCSALEPDEDATTTPVEGDRARELAVEFAPTLYFDEHERWFPTDPRPYVTEGSDGPVVSGFDALDGYADAFAGGTPPAPTVFYHVVQYGDSPLAVVQYWMYTAFDQFTTNFHWHDWEVLHVFVDTAAGEPQLYVASSHSRKVPNNEFLDPDAAPRVLSELGSHSSALSVNDDPLRFQRFPTGGDVADITNGAIEGLGDLADLPAAYGLPRDEGGRLPYLVPELDGAPVYDHERLPSVERSDLLAAALTVRSFESLVAPPSSLPERRTGLVLGHADSDGRDADVTYDLVSTGEVEHIAAFTGPQLSFEFAVPEFAEDAVASHITTAGTPWDQRRYDEPAADITDPNHRAAMAERYDAIGAPSPVGGVVAAITEAVPSGDAPEGKGLTTDSLPVEAVALLESEATAVPTFRGVAMARDVPEGDHRLTVNGAGVAPHSETVSVAEGEGPTAAGVGGEVPLVARGQATKLEVDTRNVAADLTDLAVEDDFAGRLYDAPLSGPDAVYIHRGGAYTTEVRDADDAVGAFRVTPADEAAIRIEEPRTGKAPLADFVADIAAETRTDVAAATDGATATLTVTGDERTATPTDTPDGRTATDGQDGGGTEVDGTTNAVRGLAQALGAVADAAERAADRAAAGDRQGADRSLAAVSTALGQVAERLAAARGDLPGGVARATDRRLDQARRRTEQARASEKL